MRKRAGRPKLKDKKVLVGLYFKKSEIRKHRDKKAFRKFLYYKIYSI